MGEDGSKFKFHCPSCGKALNAPSNAVGQRADCPHCKASITVPDGQWAKPSELQPPSISLEALVASGEPPSWRDVVQTNRDYVPLIECACGVGSGLLVSRDGLVVTNRHVVERSRVFMLRFLDGSKARAVIVHLHGTRDLAMIRAAIRRESSFDMKSAVGEGVEAGDDVLAIGHPRGLAFTATCGIVSEPHRLLIDGEYVQTDVAINPGNSGGPLLDRFGNLVGLNTRIQAESEGLGFAIGGKEVQAYVLYVKDQLARAKLHMPSDDEIAKSDQSLSPWDIACAAARASGLSYREITIPISQPALAVLTARNNALTISIGGNLFRVTGCVAANLSDKQLHDHKLLYQLLRWQNELCGPSFDVNSSTLHLGVRRSIEGLDVTEAREAILRVADAFDALYPAIQRHLGR